MNIFILDNDPELAAKMMCDKHIVKMPLETAQMLSTVNGGPYKPTHANHPCTLWIKASAENYSWLVKHGIALCQEYTERYGKEHKSEEIIMALSEPLVEIPKVKMTPFALALPDEFKTDDPVASYRAYYKFKMSQFRMTWKSNQPSWIENAD